MPRHHNDRGQRLCRVDYPDAKGHTTMATSVFAAAANALRWVEVHRRDFGTARRFRDDEILRMGVGMVPSFWYPSESPGFAGGKPAGATGSVEARRALEE